MLGCFLALMLLSMLCAAGATCLTITATTLIRVESGAPPSVPTDGAVTARSDASTLSDSDWPSELDLFAATTAQQQEQQQQPALSRNAK